MFEPNSWFYLDILEAYTSCCSVISYLKFAPLMQAVCTNFSLFCALFFCLGMCFGACHSGKLTAVFLVWSHTQVRFSPSNGSLYRWANAARACVCVCVLVFVYYAGPECICVLILISVWWHECFMVFGLVQVNYYCCVIQKWVSECNYCHSGINNSIIHTVKSEHRY